MVRGSGKQKQLLSVAETATLNDEKKELELTLKETEGYGKGTERDGAVDVSRIRMQIDRIDKAIEEGRPGRLTSMQKDALLKESKSLEEKFMEGLPTKWEMDHPAKCPGAVRKHMKWITRFERTGLVERYRTIQRLLNPGEELSIESLRKEK